MKLSPYLFWDVAISNIDFERNARHIIEKVLSRGTLADWREINRFYGYERIKKEIVHIRYLDNVTLNFCSKYFQVPLNQFKCYNTTPLTKELWNY